MPTHTRPRAFTLIELLTVIAIVGIMAAITIPVVGKVRESANNVQCASALRSWGIALQLYVDEHKGMLPGPCWAVVENLPGNNRQLPYFLAPYMNSTLKKGKLPDNFLCRAWAHDRTKEDTAIWQLVRVAKRAGGSGIRPFGYPNSDTEPVRNYHTLDDIINIRTAIAIRDIDKGVASNDGLPEKPVHKNHRNVLFFDWHVGTEAAN